MNTSSATYLVHELMAQFGWRAWEDGNLDFACEAMRLAKNIILFGVFPELKKL